MQKRKLGILNEEERQEERILLKKILKDFGIWLRDLLLSFCSIWLKLFCVWAVDRPKLTSEIIKSIQSPDTITCIMVLAYISAIEFNKKMVELNGCLLADGETIAIDERVRKAASLWTKVNYFILVFELAYCIACYSQKPVYSVDFCLMLIFVSLAIVVTLTRIIIIACYNKRIETKK